MNKIKVFLVEDEFFIRNGIEKSIKWDENGYEFVGDAGDGEVALPLILKTKPDILITDVKMPFMNGLELSRIVKQELPETKIIILSGYNEFDYAKEAINLSVTEYLLKPISAAQLLESLNKVKESLTSEREKQELLKKYSEEMGENTESARIRFFRKLLFGDMSTGDAIEGGKKYGISLSVGTYCVIIFKILPAVESDDPFANAFEVESDIDSIADSMEDVIAIQKGVEGWAFLLMAETPEAMDSRIEEVRGRFIDMMKKYSEIEYFGGIGRKVVRIKELKKSYMDADKAFIGRFSLKSNQIITLDQLKSFEEDTELSSGFANVEHSREIIGKYLNSGTRNEIDDFVNLYMEEFTRDALTSEIMRQYLIMDIYITVMAFYEKLGATDETFRNDAEQIRTRMQKQQSPDEMAEELKKLLLLMITLRDGVSERRYSDIIGRAKDILEETYMQDDISLNSVAEMVGMSPSYFSSIFSKEAGKTFVEYLTEIRMEKAKELLMCSSMKTSEIGHRVGYKDSHYFSYIFKKKQGCSPKEYRARKKGS